MKFKVGQKWRNRMGEVFVIIDINEYSAYPITAIKYKSKNNTELLYSMNGAFAIDGQLGRSMDLIELIEESEVTKEEYEEIREEEKIQSEPEAKTFGFDSSVAETLAQRGGVYGKFNEQVKCVSALVSAMTDCATANNLLVSQEQKAEWYYLAIKLARIASNPEHTDSYHDLAGYAMLLEKEYEHTN